MGNEVGMIEMGTGILVPYNLYNFVQNGKVEAGYQPGMGTSGNLFSMGPGRSTFFEGNQIVFYWNNLDPFSAAAESGLDENYGPIFTDSSAFGGSFCGEAFSCIFHGSEGQYFLTEQLFRVPGTFDGNFWMSCRFDCWTLPYIFDTYLYDNPSAAGLPIAFMEYETNSVPSGDFTVGMTLDVTGQTSTMFFDTTTITADDYFRAPCSALGNSGEYARCSGFPPNSGFYNPEWGSVVDGFAQMRGTLTEADMAYWMAYDWATHPGFA